MVKINKPGMKKVTKEIGMEDISISHQPNKVSKDNYDIVYYQKSTGVKLNHLSEKNINKNNIHFIDSFKDELIKNNLTPSEFPFKSYLDSINPKIHTHFIDSIIDQCISVEASFKNDFIEYDEHIKLCRIELSDSMNPGNILSESKVNHLEYISDDIYGTTTMEGNIVEKEYIDEILQNKHIKGETLSQMEAVNVRDGFRWSVIKSLEGKSILSVDLINEAHSINTSNLDDYVTEGLLYNPGSMRDELVNMGIFKRHDGQLPYMPPKDPLKGLNNFIEYFNTGDLNISKIAHLHLIIYSLHPYTNGNKRTTRVIESLYIQRLYDPGHLFKGMGYWFKKNINTYIKELRNVLSGKTSLKKWNIYYMQEFQKMSEYSVYEYNNLKFDILTRIPSVRHRYYDDKDKIFYRFYLSNKDNFFTIKDVNQYLVKNAISYNDLNTINKRFSKHVKDELIMKTDQKQGKMAVYRFNI